MPTANQPTSMTTGTSSAASQPAGIRLLSAAGSSRIHTNPAMINAKGMRNSIENTAGRWLSTNGANQSPAKKPRITVGTASDRKSTRLNSSHVAISYAVLCLKKKKSRQPQNHYKKEKSE